MKRTGFIGGSDVAAILGVHPYRTALAVWAEKTGKVETDETIADKPAVAWGNRLERTIGKHWSALTGIPLNWKKRDCLVVHPRFDWFRGHIDAEALGQRCRVLEVKTAGIRQAGRWGPSGSTDPADVPIEYVCQLQSYLWAKFSPSIVTATDLIMTEHLSGAIAVLIAGQDFRCYELQVDLELWKQFDRYIPEFWSMVQEQRPPDPDYRDNPWMSALYDRVARETRLVDNEVSSIVRDLVSAKAQIKRITTEKEGYEARIKMYMTDHQYLVDATGEVLATWKSNPVTRFQTKLFEKEHPRLKELFSKTTMERRFLLKAGDED